jgi:hypothetical protein
MAFPWKMNIFKTPGRHELVLDTMMTVYNSLKIPIAVNSWNYPSPISSLLNYYDPVLNN